MTTKKFLINRIRSAAVTNCNYGTQWSRYDWHKYVNRLFRNSGLPEAARSEVIMFVNNYYVKG